jgi:putative transposase
VRDTCGRDTATERRACRVLSQARNTQRRRASVADDERQIVKRRKLWLGVGSCIRLRPTHRNRVWTDDFVMDRTVDGRSLRMLTIVDEFTRE